jgi:hypothetical protein
VALAASATGNLLHGRWVLMASQVAVLCCFVCHKQQPVADGVGSRYLPYEPVRQWLLGFGPKKGDVPDS